MNSVTINHITKEGIAESKEIYELLEIDNSKYRLMGQSLGINMNHCVMLGAKHALDFWHRVYAYKIVQNKEQEQIILEAMRKIKPEVKSYITVCFYERFSKKRFMYVPHRLEIPDRPELNNFPFNIVFSTICIADNDKETIETSTYNPELETFVEEGIEQKMRYYNNLDDTKRFCIEITYNTSNKSYVGIKYNKDKNIGMAEGSRWDMFFVHLTALGVASGQNMND